MRLLVFLFALLLTPAASAQTLDDLAWLKGCWRTESDGPVVTEVWIAPPGPAMFGYSFTEGEGAIQGWEQTRIEMVDGWPHFVAMPNGAAAVRFRLREDGEPNLARFDNPAHDYPQTVEYRRDGAWLVATISGVNGANPLTFRYRRIRCSANLRP